MKTLIAVRNVDRETFRKFRAKSIEKGVPLGDAMTKAMRHWLNEEPRKRPDPSKFRDMIGSVKTKGPVRWSEEVDEILYGTEQ